MHTWPDAFDLIWTITLLLLAVAAPILGYVLVAIDIRAYIRALRGALVRFTYHFPGVPTWARQETPACLTALGLRLPCSAEQVRQAYHRIAEHVHPDRGGDRRRFSQLQKDFESSLRFLVEHDQLAAGEEPEVECS